MRRSKAMLAAVAVCLLAVLFSCVAYGKTKITAQDLLPEGITLSGKSLAGMTETEARDAIEDYADTLLGRTITLELADTQYELSMEELGVFWKNPEAVDMVDGMSMEGNVISRYKKMKDVENNPVKISIELELDTEALNAKIEEYTAACSVEKEEAGLTHTPDGFVVTEGHNGVSFDTEEIAAALEKYISDDTKSEDYVYTAKQIVDKQEADVEAYSGFKGDLLGTYTTMYNSAESNRSTNIRLAASQITGHTYLPGEEFSILELINPVTREAGYLEAGTYENGEVVQGIGGGICQMATTIYDAALRAEMEITYRRNHSMVAAYVPYAWDAMIFAASESDFKFINNTDYPIYIEVGIAEGGMYDPKYQGDSALTVSIYGTETRPENRTIVFRSVTKSVEWSDPIYNVVVDPNLAEHQTKELTAAHPAVSAECWKDIYVDGALQESVLINSSLYKSGIGLMSIGTDITFKSWPVPGENGFPKIYQDINWTSSLRKAEEEKRKEEEEKRKAEQAAAESSKAAQESSAAPEAPADPTAEAPTQQ